MKNDMRLALCFLLLCFACPIAGQLACEPFDNVPQPCQTFLVGNWSWVMTAPVFGYSQEVLHARMLDAALQDTPTTFVSLLDYLPTLDYECGLAYAKVLCLAYFHPCDSQTQQPLSVCRSVCLDYLQTCGASALVDLCNLTNALTGLPMFVDTEGCSDNSQAETDSFVYPCPKPTIYAPGFPKELPCSVPCKQQMYSIVSKDEFDDVFVMISVLSWISMFASLATIGVYCFFPALREYPSRLAICVAVGALLYDIAWVGNSVQNPEDFLCDSNAIDFSQSGWCAFSGFLVYLGAMIVASWWCIQVLVLTYNIGFKQYNVRLDRKYEWVMHVWGWGYSLVCAFVLAFVPNGHGTGAVAAIPYCVGSYSQPQGLDWGLFYGVVVGYMFIVTVGLSITIFQLIKMGIESKMPITEQLNAFLSILSFGLWFLASSAAVITLQSYADSTDPATQAAFENWVQCWFISKDKWQECQFDFNFNYDTVWWVGIMLSLSGTVIFLVFVPLSARTRQTFSSRNSSLPMSINNSDRQE